MDLTTREEFRDWVVYLLVEAHSELSDLELSDEEMADMLGLSLDDYMRINEDEITPREFVDALMSKWEGKTDG